MRIKTAIGLLLFFAYLAPAAWAEGFLQLPGVIHVHTTFSSGKYSVGQLVAKAKDKNLAVLVLTDHDLVVMEYGLPPLRRIIKKRKERRSVIQLGPQNYLAEIERQNNLQNDVIIIPGVQSSPFYYWTGSPLKQNLTAHDYRKELLLVGMQKPADYRQVPILHNGYSKRFFLQLFPRSVFFLISFFIGLFLFFQRKMLKILGAVVGVCSLLLLINHHPFQCARFDSYHGDQGIEPYQEVIDYVHQHQGLTFWAHPESNYSAAGVVLGPIKLVTRHYANDLIDAKNYTGFSAIYGDTFTATNPGRQWDRALNQFCQGKRDKAPWAIAGADFHRENKGVQLDSFQTIFLVKSKTAAEVLDALSNGRVYAVRKSKEPRMVLEKFQITDRLIPKKAVMGESLDLRSIPILEGRVSAINHQRMTVHVSLIRGGKIWQSFVGVTPLEFHFADQDNWSGKTFYRLEIRDSTHGKLLSNPIFVGK
ncbi:MAG: PHP domain-containing protein [Desulfobacterales bacterium]|jgi:hypothetical protein